MLTKPSFRCVTRGLLAGGMALLAGMAAAWPTKPVQLLVGYPAGGSADVLARALGESMSRSLGQSVVVVNRDGAGGTLATGVMANSTDAHTLAFGPAGPLVLQPHVKAN